MKRILFLSLTSLMLVTSLHGEDTRDVVVYGGTSGGITAAIQVARSGKSVVLIEPGRHLGGLTSGGLGMTDSGNRAVIGGMSREFYQRVRKHYEKDAAWRQEKPSQYKYMQETTDALWRFEPHVAEAIYKEMLAEAKVECVLGERLDLKKGVRKEGARIVSLTMESGKIFSGRMFVDATYEGDVMAKAGVSYTVGRESNEQYGETLNGVQTKNAKKHQFVFDVDPYVKPGDPASGLLPGVSPNVKAAEGSGDHRVQAYCFRMCLTDAPENQVPFPQPEGYDPLRYELFLRYLEKGWSKVWGNHQMMPNRKSDTNNDGAFSTDNIGMNYEYPDGNYALREKIIKEHETYQKGFFWFICNDPRVPEAVRNDVRKWGLSKDEFTDNGNWPHQIYVREARRMISDYVHTEHDCRRTRETPDSAGMGSYNMDSHNVQRYVDERGFARNEGDIQVSPGGPYRISYRSLRPKESECENLLVPVCISCTHIAYGSVRMEPVFMILGQSCGAAACLALDGKTSVQDVPYDKLRERLLAEKQVLEFAAPPKSASLQEAIAPSSLKGIVVDNTKAKLTGDWPAGSSIPGFVGADYLHDDDEGKGRKSVRYEFSVAANGECEVRLFYTANPNRATNVPVRIICATGEKTATINQRNPPPGGAPSVSLGVFAFKKDEPGAVEISNEGTDGHVIADAVQVLPK